MARLLKNTLVLKNIFNLTGLHVFEDDCVDILRAFQIRANIPCCLGEMLIYISWAGGGSVCQ